MLKTPSFPMSHLAAKIAPRANPSLPLAVCLISSLSIVE